MSGRVRILPETIKKSARVIFASHVFGAGSGYLRHDEDQFDSSFFGDGGDPLTVTFGGGK